MTEPTIYPCARHAHLARTINEPGSGLTFERALEMLEPCPDCEVIR